jgi:hypothetical protein
MVGDTKQADTSSPSPEGQHGSVGVAAVGKIGTRPNWALMLKFGTVGRSRTERRYSPNRERLRDSTIIERAADVSISLSSYYRRALLMGQWCALRGARDGQKPPPIMTIIGAFVLLRLASIPYARTLCQGTMRRQPKSLVDLRAWPHLHSRLEHDLGSQEASCVLAPRDKLRDPCGCRRFGQCAAMADQGN